MTTELSAPVLTALRTDHAAFALATGRAYRYPGRIGPFAALAEDTQEAWDELAAGTRSAMVERSADFEPEGWALDGRVDLQLMISIGKPREDDGPRIVRLGDEHVHQMSRLAEECALETFRPGSMAIGEYLGVMDGAALVAMAGTRFSTPGWREIACVGTTPSHRGRGLAAALVAAVDRLVRTTGRSSYLNVEADNPAVELYHGLGFRLHHTRTVDIRSVVRAPHAA